MTRVLNLRLKNCEGCPYQDCDEDNLYICNNPKSEYGTYNTKQQLFKSCPLPETTEEEGK